MKRPEAMRIGVALWLLLVAACGRVTAPREAEGFSGDRALAWVARQVDLGPRFPGSPGHQSVRELISGALGDAGWSIESQEFDYLGQTLTNLSGERQADGGPLVIVGAHYDTRRVADRDTIRPEDPVPGANDGASGVAVLLELARLLPGRAVGCEVRLVFFDGEDNGGLDGWEWAAGARHFAQNLSTAPEAVVVVDMVGDADLKLPIERTSTPELVEEIWGWAEAAGLPAFSREPGPSVLDDHTPFLERGWRAVDIIDLSYPYWHTTADTFDKVSADSLAQVGRGVMGWLESSCGTNP